MCEVTLWPGTIVPPDQLIVEVPGSVTTRNGVPFRRTFPVSSNIMIPGKLLVNLREAATNLPMVSPVLRLAGSLGH